jgi:hypothetical protein
MSAKSPLILGASLIASCLILGLFFGQPSTGQAPAALAKAESRYQVVPLSNNNNYLVVVFDPATGQCWYREVNKDFGDEPEKAWFNLGTPVKKK